MDLKEIHYLTTIADCGSLSKAAEKLYMAQSSLSQFLKKYEDNLGYPLFIRTNHGLALTYEGLLHVDAARQIIGIKYQLEHQIGDAAQLKRGKVRFAISPYRAPYLLPRLLPLFHDKYPGITVEISEASMENQELLLQKGVVDIGFLSPPVHSQGIVLEPLIEEEIFLAAHPKYQLQKIALPITHDAATHKIHLPDVIGEHFLLYSVDHRLRHFSEMLFEEFKIRPTDVQFHDSFETIIRLAAVGMGVTFIPETYIDPNNTLEYYSIGPMGRSRSLAAGLPPNGYLSKAGRVFLDTMKDVVQSQKLNSI